MAVTTATNLLKIIEVTEMTMTTVNGSLDVAVAVQLAIMLETLLLLHRIRPSTCQIVSTNVANMYLKRTRIH